VNPSLELRTVRSNISQRLAFPLGYEQLHSAFGHIANWDEARFYYCDKPTTWASEFAEILRSNKPYCILRIERQRESDIVAHWSFTIYPVERISKSLARDALLASADLIRAFLKHSPTFSTYYNLMNAIYDPTDNSCHTNQLYEFRQP
jgi:hypothetical protein